MDISIIILNYKSNGLALNCIKSIRESDFQKSPQPPLSQHELRSAGQARGHIKYEIIVVDNNSDDSIGEILNWQYPEIKFIQNEKNIGMGAGNNVGIRAAVGKYVVIANPDILVLKNTFKVLYEFMEANNNVGAVGPRQFNPDKTVQNSCYRWYNLFTPIYRRTPLGKFKFAKKDLDRFLMKDESRPRGSASSQTLGVCLEVDWLLGSFLFCRAEALKKIGMFDERFFLYFEDTDLCRRFWENNWKVVYSPEAEVIHNHARKSAQEPWYKFLGSAAARFHIASWVKYLKKWGITRNL